jgi:hypothetical protein
MVMLKVVVLVALVAGVSALHPSMRLLSDGMRQTLEVGRLLDAQEDTAKAAVAKCVVALTPPSITSFNKCIGVDLGLVATGDAAAMAAATAAFQDLQKEGAILNNFTTGSKESCTAIFSTKIIQCSQIMFTSDIAAYLEKNPFPTSVAALPAGCADITTIASQNATVSAASNQQLADPQDQGASNVVKTACGAQAGGRSGFSAAKAAFAQMFSECSKTGVNPTSQLSTEDAAAVKAALVVPTSAPTPAPSTVKPTPAPSTLPTNALAVPTSAPPSTVPTNARPTSAAGLVASVVLAATAVVVAL